MGHKEGVFPSNFVAVLNDQRENHSSDATGRDVEKCKCIIMAIKNETIEVYYVINLWF